MKHERRNLTSLGRKRRRDFDRSVQKLRDLGLTDWAVEYYGRAARMAGVLPHMVVCQVALIAASREISKPGADTDGGPEQARGSAEQPQLDPMRAAPSYRTVHTLKRRVTELWREIQRHESAPAASAAAAPPGSGPAKQRYLPAAATGHVPEDPRARKRSKASPKQH